MQEITSLNFQNKMNAKIIGGKCADYFSVCVASHCINSWIAGLLCESVCFSLSSRLDAEGGPLFRMRWSFPFLLVLHQNTQFTHVSFDSLSEMLIRPLPRSNRHGTWALFYFDAYIMYRQTPLSSTRMSVTPTTNQTITMKAIVLVIQKSDKTTTPWTAGHTLR